MVHESIVHESLTKDDGFVHFLGLFPFDEPLNHLLSREAVLVSPQFGAMVLDELVVQHQVVESISLCDHQVTCGLSYTSCHSC